MRRKATPEYNLQTEFPEIAAEWHPTLNGSLKPGDVTPGMRRRAWWLCKKGHSWEAFISNRSKGSGCPACAGTHATPEYNLLTQLPDVAAFWHPSKNGGLEPASVTPKSGKKVWWMCKRGHEWQSRICNFNGCLMCSGMRATPEYNLLTEKPEVAAEWHPTKNGDLKPADVTPGSGRRVWWLCKDGHVRHARICDRVEKGCPGCRGTVAVPGNNLADDHPELVKHWLRSNKKKPREVTSGSEYRAEWECPECGHQCRKRVYDMVRRPGCPCCAGRVKIPNKLYIQDNYAIWTRKTKPHYETVGKIEVCEMFQETLLDLGYFDLGFLNLPGNGREIKQMIDNGFGFDYDGCLGVERGDFARKTREFFEHLFKIGEIDGVMPIVQADVDELVLYKTDHVLPEFNAVHLDYNGPLTKMHVRAVEAALKNNPDAVVAITVSQVDRFKRRDIEYTFGDFPFATLEPELLFYQPYQGIKAQWMETYCFRNRGIWTPGLTKTA